MSTRADLRPAEPADVPDLRDFLRLVDLTVSGLDSPRVNLWLSRDEDGRVVATTGFEVSGDGRHALIRSVAVDPTRRSAGRGSELARFALARATEGGAQTAWLFSRRSGPFWRTLGFTPADREELAKVLADTHQVRLFHESGQLALETTWSRRLHPHCDEGPWD